MNDEKLGDIGFSFSMLSGESISAVLQQLNEHLIKAVRLPPAVLQSTCSSDSGFYRTMTERQHDWQQLIMTLLMLVTSDSGQAVNIATQLRDRYPGLTLNQIDQSVRSGCLCLNDSGYFLQRGVRSPVYQTFALSVTPDPVCKYNALSPYLLCAVNPSGSCEGCGSFEQIEERDRA